MMSLNLACYFPLALEERPSFFAIQVNSNLYMFNSYPSAVFDELKLYKFDLSDVHLFIEVGLFFQRQYSLIRQ